MAHIGSDGDGYMPVLYISCPSLLRPLPTWGHTDVNVMDVESAMSRLRLGIAFLLPAPPFAGGGVERLYDYHYQILLPESAGRDV